MAHKQYQACKWYEQYKAMRDIREVELRDSGSNTNTKICFEIRATAVTPQFLKSRINIQIIDLKRLYKLSGVIIELSLYILKKIWKWNIVG